MYNLQKNIQTPPKVSRFIFELLSPFIPKQKGKLILDPCCGQGNLLDPWWVNNPWGKDDYWAYGIDIEENSKAKWKTDFLNLKISNWQKQLSKKPALILCNPPFSGYKNKLAPEVWLDKIIELFGKGVPIVLFAPIGFRLNLTTKSSRWQKLTSEYPPISSIIALPKDIFEGVVFHSERSLGSFSQEKVREILIFNVEGLKGHYFFSSKDHE